MATNAPGRSAFNRVERRMAPLSRELAGLILSHDHYGSHLDSQGKTIDEEVEKQNFEFAGKTLAELWSQVVIDGFPTISEYIDPEFGELRSERLHSKDLDWMAEHEEDRTSQYLTQIFKCADINCCGKRRSPYFSLISSRFLLPPSSHCSKLLMVNSLQNGSLVMEINFRRFFSLFRQMLLIYYQKRRKNSNRSPIICFARQCNHV